MLRKYLYLDLLMSSALLVSATQSSLAYSANLSAVQIVDKNVEARGGLQAWRAVQALSFSGTMGVGGNQRSTLPAPTPIPGRRGIQPTVPTRPAEEVRLPFVMELKRPRKMRFQLDFAGQTAVQVFDGNSGWKLRPYLNRRVVEPYTAEEMGKASEQAELDGRLVDYVAKGTRVELLGTEKVEDGDAYNLKLTLKGGQVTHVWIDAKTFLEVKIEGTPRRLDGTDHPVEVYLRDYRAVNGLQIPFVLETRVLPVAKTTTGLRDVPVPPEKLVIDKVNVNPRLDDARFTKPEIQMASLTK